MSKLLSCLLAVCVLLTAFTVMPVGIGTAANDDEAAETMLPDSGYSASGQAVPDEDPQISSSAVPDESDSPASGLSPSEHMLSALPDSKYLDSLTDSIENMRRYYENKYQDTFEGEPAEVRAYYSDKYSNEFEHLLEKYRDMERRFPELSSDSMADDVSADVMSDDVTDDEEIASTGASDLTYDLTDGVLTVYASGEWFSGKQPPWRSRRDEIREVIIKPGTTMINQYAFYADKNLSKVTIPSSVTSIGEAAFYECASLAQITLPDKLEAIGEAAFRGCTSLKSITIPDSVEKLEATAFYGCSALDSAVIGSSVEEIGSHSFRNCTSLKKVTIKDGVGGIGYAAFHSGSFNEIEIPSSVAVIGDNAFRSCTSLKRVTINYGVGGIGECAFYECTSLSEIDIPSSVTSLGRFAFNDCASLTSITIPDSVTEMGTFVFQSCAALESVVLPIKMKVIPSDTFRNCKKLTYVRFPRDLETISSFAFENAAAYKVNIPSTVKVIESYAFQYTSTNGTITIPDSVERIESYAFSKVSGLQRVSIGSGLSVIGDNPFRDDDDLSEINISSSNPFFSSIDGAMYDKNMMLVAYPPARAASTVVIPDGVTEIGAYAFCHAYNIKKLTLPDSVISIGDNAFESSTYLSYANGERKLISKNTFESFVFSKNLKEIGERAFYDCGFTRLDLPDSLNRIGEGAFGGAVLPDSVTIPKNVDSIGESPFWLSDISNINVSSANPYYKSVNGAILTKDGKVFVELPYLKTSYAIPNGVEEIANGAFESTKLTSVTFPDTLRVIGRGAFSSTHLSGDITLPDSVSKIDLVAFSLCDEMTGITLGKGLSYLGGSAFSNCDKLVSVRFKGNAPELEKGSIFAWYPDYSQFVNCDLTVTAYYPQNDSSWNDTITYDFGDTVTWKPWDSTIVEKINISSCDISLDTKPLVYDGTAKQPSVTVKYKGAECMVGIDYNLKYENYINAGKAVVTVTGSGRYTGSKTLNYNIQKASQTVTASLTPNELKAGDSASIEASGKGALSYSVSPSGIAEVNSAGLVTAKSKGSAVITVKAAGDSNYSSNEARVNVTVKEVETKRYGTADLTYDFENYWTDLGYVTYVGKGKGRYSYNSSTGKYEFDPYNGSYVEDEEYEIPLDSYKMFFSDAEATWRYNDAGYWSGSCSGFVGVSLILNAPSISLVPSDFRSTAKHISDLAYSDKSFSMNIPFVKFIECMQVAQAADPVATVKYQNKNDIAGLVEEVKKCDRGALPIYVSVRNNSGGHALAAYKYEYVDSKSDRIYLYDCNDAYKEHYLTLYKENGKYTGFRYEQGYTYTSSISYVPANYYIELWNNRRKSYSDYSSSIFVSSDDFDLLDSYGNKAASMRGGVLVTSDKDIFEVTYDDIEMDSHELKIPSCSYKVVSYDTSPSNELEVSMIDNDQTVSVKTESDTVSLFADETQALSIVTIDGNEGEYYEVTVNSSMDYSKDKEEMVYRGKSEGYEVTVGSSYGEDFSYQYTRSGYFVNSDAYNTGASGDTPDISYGEITLDMTSVDYTGEPVYPQPTVVYNGMTLTRNIDYIVAYTPAGSDGTAKATVYGINKYTGSISADYTVNKLDISSGKINLGASSFPLTGGAVKPVPTLSVNGVILSNNTDYTVTYENNTAVGTATIILSGINDCTGTVSATFHIVDYASKPLIGDADGDGNVTILDATRIQRWLASLCDMNGGVFTGAQLTATQKKAADADGDNSVTIMDATAIQRFKADLPTNGNIGKPG